MILSFLVQAALLLALLPVSAANERNDGIGASISKIEP